MTAKPEIKVGQRWVTRGGDIARVVATDGKKPGYPVIIETSPGDLWTLMDDGTVPMLGAVSEYDLIALMPEGHTMIEKEMHGKLIRTEYELSRAGVAGSQDEADRPIAVSLELVRECLAILRASGGALKAEAIADLEAQIEDEA